MTAVCSFTGLKECNACHLVKEPTDFSNDKTRSDGKQSRCKACHVNWRRENKEKCNQTSKIWSANWREKNRSFANLLARQRYADNPEKFLKAAQKWKSAKPEYHSTYLRMYGEKNRGKIYAWNAARRAFKLRATVAWANQDKIREFYDAARILTKAFGTPWHVDHIVPLKSDIVCGLHCEANLQLLPGLENLKKSNRYWPDMPT